MTAAGSSPREQPDARNRDGHTGGGGQGQRARGTTRRQALRDSHGLAIAISDDQMVSAMREFGQLEGISASPEGGATLCALRTLLTQDIISPTDVVVLFNTGGALKYLELID